MSENDPIKLLATTATIAERTRGLLMLLPPTIVADAVGVRASSLRNWVSGQSQPRSEAAILLDDLRATAKVLLDGGIEPGRATAWLTSRNPENWDGMRPVEAIRMDPMDVLAAAHGVVLEQAKTAEGTSRPKDEPTLVLVSD